jgi:hypothetical protein
MDLSRELVVQLVLTWIRNKTPGAVVRFGEGEGRLLWANPHDELSIGVACRKLRRQAGRSFAPREMFEVRSRVMHAFDEADVVGIRGGPDFNDEHLMWIRRIERVFEERRANRRRPAFVTHCFVSRDLTDALDVLLEDQEAVTIVSCRDVRPIFESRYGVRDVRVHQIPSQYRKREVDGEYEAEMHHIPMWPDFYRELQASISVRQRGEVFIVGAGLFGKDLCIRIRELGGIALDLGSCLDEMAGKDTRGESKHRDRSAFVHGVGP